MKMESLQFRRKNAADWNTVEDIESIPCARLYIYDRGNGRKTAFLHFVDGMQIYDLCPGLWHGWKLGHTIVGESEVH